MVQEWFFLHGTRMVLWVSYGMIRSSPPIRRILRDPVRRTVYRARCQDDTKIIRPFVPLSKIVYRYNVMQASRANRTCCGSTKTRTKHRSTLVSPTKADAAGKLAKGENQMSIRIVHVSELTKRPVRVPKPKKTR